MTVSTTRRNRASAVLGLAILGLSVAALWMAPVASAKQPPTTVRLGVTGMVTTAAPHGTWSLSARPGQTLEFLAGFVPGVDSLQGNQALTVQVSMDAPQLSGGAHAKTLTTQSPYRLTLNKPGRYPLNWTVAFVLGHGRKSTVEATRSFNASILVGGSSGGRGLVSPGDARSTPIRSANPPASPRNVVTTPHQSASRSSAATVPAPAVASTITLPPDTGATHRANPAAIAPLPLAAAADTYLFTGIVGTFVIGFLWLLWVASIRPILGR